MNTNGVSWFADFIFCVFSFRWLRLICFLFFPHHDIETVILSKFPWFSSLSIWIIPLVVDLPAWMPRSKVCRFQISGGVNWVMELPGVHMQIWKGFGSKSRQTNEAPISTLYWLVSILWWEKCLWERTLK